MVTKKKATKEASPHTTAEGASPPPSETLSAEAPLSQLSRLDWIFDYHRPTEDQVDKYNQISAAAKALAKVILIFCPECADRSDAIRKVREAKMTAVASIALHGQV